MSEDVRTSVILDREVADRIKASAKEDRRGWTNQLWVLAIEALDAREAKKGPAGAADASA